MIVFAVAFLLVFFGLLASYALIWRWSREAAMKDAEIARKKNMGADAE